MFGFGRSGDFPQSQLIPSIIKLGDYLRKGFEHRMNSRVQNIEVDRDALENYIKLVTHDWNPIVNGQPIFDNETKQHAIKFISGIAYNLTKEEEKC